MIRLVLANSEHKSAVNAAAKTLGLQCIFRVFSGVDLMELKAPVLIAFEPARSAGLTPDFLQYLRRTNTGGVRYSPAVVFCKDRDETIEWRIAGASPMGGRPGVAEITAAFRQALQSERKWIASEEYVGPERRARNAVFKVHKRRREDGAATAAKAQRVSANTIPVSSLDRLHRRLLLGAQLLRGSSIESRRAFRGLTDEFEVSVRAHGRADLSGLTYVLRGEADRLLKDANADTTALEAAIARLGALVDC